MASITIPNTTAGQATLEAVPLDLIESRDALVDQAFEASRTITTPEAFAAANVLYKSVQACISAIETRRKECTGPLLALQRDLMAAANGAKQPLEAVKAALGPAIHAYEVEENRKREEARRIAEAEQAQRQREADAAAEQERQRLIEEAELMAPPGEVPAEIPVTAVLPERVVTAYVPPPVKSAVRETVSYSVRVVDLAKVPREISGVPLFILDEKTALGLLKAKMAIPGLELVETRGLGAKGSR